MAANGDLLRQLLRGHMKRDDGMFRVAAEAIIQDERAKNHRLLADDLERILINGNGSILERRSIHSTIEVPKDRERGFPLVDIAEFSYDWDRLILPAMAKQMLQRIVEEHRRREVLAAGGIKPKQRILFYGPPGCGKTLAAKTVAGVLNYPLVTVRFDAVVSSYLGETAANLRRVFDFITRGQWVVLFDEFDAIGKERDNAFEHGELKRVVNTLLQLMDAFQGESLMIAATNHAGLLDNALWRRFEAIIPFSIPSAQDRILLSRLFLRGLGSSELDHISIGRRMKGATGSDVELVCIEAARTALLAGRNTVLKADMDHAIRCLQERISMVRKLRTRTEDTSAHSTGDVNIPAEV